MKNIHGVWLILLAVTARGQFYYRDLAGTRETSATMRRYLAAHVRQVSLTSYEPDGSVSENFQVTQWVDPVKRTLITLTRSGITDQSELTSWFDPDGRLLKTADTSGGTLTTAVYAYDSRGNLASMQSYSGDTLKSGSETEVHLWSYDPSGRPLQMTQIVNGRDTTLYRFTLDGQGNVIQETPSRQGKDGDPVYYYYDSQNRLSDIVRYNYKLKKLLPDYMFEYSPSNQVVQKITIPANYASEYLIWRYQYDEKGLKTKEVCYNKDKQLTGRIEYTYQFAP
ncbi:MAG TPA: hypothetical protein VG870_02470 [Chitinophagaceae bacterium]|nr:hypothetical protein [Chitinophagaceae bacterium]